jgi:carbon-monoxide dehydrogenase large subunit
VSADEPTAAGPIGRPLPRKDARRLLEGGGRYLGDLTRPGLLQAAFVRSPHAHARILSIDTLTARLGKGVVAVLTAEEIDGVCRPWRGVLERPHGMVSPPQHPLAGDRVAYQGEPVAMVVATSRALAEDACDAIGVVYDPLPAVVDIADALAADAPRVHPDLGDNVAFRNEIRVGDVDAVFAEADVTVVEATLRFPGVTAVTLEPRGVIAAFDPATRRLELTWSTQTPFQMRDVVATCFGLAESDIDVGAPDVGGAFGLKLHVFSDEMATVAASILLGRPIAFLADRLESFMSDTQARRQSVHGRMAFGPDGRIRAMAVDIHAGVGAYSVYPRTSFLEPNQVARLCGGPYLVPSYRAQTTSVFLNTPPSGQLRGVGHPIACAVTETLMDLGAAALGLGVRDIRERNLVPAEAFPHQSHGGFRFESLGQHEALDRIWRRTADVRERVAAARQTPDDRILTGFGIALFVELTSPGVGYYGLGGAHISSRETATARLEPSGDVTVQVAITDQGQGTETVVAQVVASAMGIAVDRVRVVHGRTLGAPYGGGAWASRGASLGGEAAYRVALALRRRILAVVADTLVAPPVDEAALAIVDGTIVEETGRAVIGLADFATRVHFRPDTLGRHGLDCLTATETYYHEAFPYTFTNGAHAAAVTIDRKTGAVRVTDFEVVADCGTVLNPLLADEQVRGAAVMGIGAALWEECRYSPTGDLETATMADYLTPMAHELPDIGVDHMATPTRQSLLGAKGAGESGIAGAQAAILAAVNDALAPTGARLDRFPLTPDRIWHALSDAAKENR